jgi:hypothetical protein
MTRSFSVTILGETVTSKPHAISRRMRPRRPMRERLADLSGPAAAARLVLSLGPATIVAGLVWAVLQPYRVTVLSPEEEGFWGLLAEPPLLVVLAGLVFHVTIARGLARDVLETDRPGRR